MNVSGYHRRNSCRRDLIDERFLFFRSQTGAGRQLSPAPVYKWADTPSERNKQ